MCSIIPTALAECNEDPTQNITDTATVTSGVTTAATCTEAGIRTYTATFTKTVFTTQTKEVTIEALGHDWEFVDISWTETTSGYTAVANYKIRRWQCICRR